MLNEANMKDSGTDPKKRQVEENPKIEVNMTAKGIFTDFNLRKCKKITNEMDAKIEFIKIEENMGSSLKILFNTNQLYY